MNILFLNNYHYLRGGSEKVYFDEMDLLKTQGHRAEAFARKSDRDEDAAFESFFPEDIKTDRIRMNLGAFKTIKEIIYSPSNKKKLQGVLSKFNPDIAHAHNIYGRLTSSVLDVLNSNNTPVVMTLHDYKLICPSYKCLNHNGVCDACINGNYLNAVVKRCHKNSVLASGIYAFESWFNDLFGKYRNNISYLISPSRFLKDKVVQSGWDAEKIRYIPNCIDMDGFKPCYEPRDYLVYIGRLSMEKGIGTLIEAFLSLNTPRTRLFIVGEGPEKESLEQLSMKDPRIVFTGYLAGTVLSEMTRLAKAVVIPSEWYENAPISLLEAFAYGKPVIGSCIGGIPEMIDDEENGFLFEPGNKDDLKETLDRFLSLNPGKMIEMGTAARAKVETRYDKQSHLKQLIELYEESLTS